MTYNVFGGTLNLTQLISQSATASTILGGSSPSIDSI